MASSLNKVMVIGNVGKEPDLRYTPDGTATSKFSVAANRVWTTPEGEKREETEWFNIVTWRDLAEKCSAYVKKGQKVYVEGRQQTRKWTDPQGVEKRFTDLIAYRIVLMWKPRSAAGGEDEGDGATVLEDSGDAGNSGMDDSLNSLMVIGTLLKDPEMHQSPDGNSRTNFTVVVKRGWKSPDGEHREETELVSVVAWKKLAETIGNNMAKGQRVFVEGRLQTRKWTDPEGVEKRLMSLVANQVVFAFKPRTTGAPVGEEETSGPPAEESDDAGADGEIPFQ